MAFKPLPIGIDGFPKIIGQGYYYVDKSLLIRDLLDRGGEVMLFTRPRRFGKTLALSMVKTFFEKEMSAEGSVTDNRHYFAGMKIMDAGEKYTGQMGKYPVISLALKSVKQPDFNTAYHVLEEQIAAEFKRHCYLLKSDVLFSDERIRYENLMLRRASRADYATAMKFLSGCLEKYHKAKVIILIDEYDVPLENAYFRGFYEEMTDFIRSFFESALKSNESLKFAMVTGCLRISKESIFTGLNNLNVISITECGYAEYFGFIDQEVRDMLRFYNRESCMETAKVWYDGYWFGNTEVYNPWSIISYVDRISMDATVFPKPFWSNTSSNDIVRLLIERADMRTKQEIEALIEGESIEKPIHEEITYADIGTDGSQDNLWNFLFFTGYLKKTGERMEENVHYVRMAIPNEEVRYIYKNTVLSWFDRQVRGRDLTEFYRSLIDGEADFAEKFITDMLRAGISFYDSKEAFYHGFMMGLFNGMKDYYATSNREAGDGRYDICLKSMDVGKPVLLIELKIASSYAQMDAKSKKALEQMEAKRYDEELVQEGYQEVLCYGIAFYRKNCKAAVERRKLSG